MGLLLRVGRGVLSLPEHKSQMRTLPNFSKRYYKNFLIRIDVEWAIFRKKKWVREEDRMSVQDISAQEFDDILRKGWVYDKSVVIPKCEEHFV